MRERRNSAYIPWYGLDNCCSFKSIFGLKNRRRRGEIFGDDFRPKNWLFGLSCQTNNEIKWKLGVAVGSFAFIIAKSRNKPRRGTPLQKLYRVCAAPKGIVFAPLRSVNGYRFSRKVRECINASVVSIPNDSERESNIRIENGFEEMFLFEL